MAATVRLSCVATYCLRLRSPYNVDIEAFPNTPASKGISTDTKVVRWLPTDRRSVPRQHWYNIMSCVAWGHVEAAQLAARSGIALEGSPYTLVGHSSD